ncbi:hypothetical protein D1007_39062 [Hordeum vulgare]|nr:hypothetical protein D1007_39062 [Hordeum vulgare]
MEIMSIATEGKKYIEELGAHLEEHETIIKPMEVHEHDYANEIVELYQALENEQTTKKFLEETFAPELSSLKESHDRAPEVANDFRTKNDKLEVAHAELFEDYEHLENGSRSIKSLLTELTNSHAQLDDSYAKEVANFPSPLVVTDDACATNSISCKASILKENVELRTQLEVLSSNYGKLEESHVMLTRSHDDLLASHNVLKLAHEAITTKVTSTYTSYSTCVDINHVEEIKELKAQVTYLKKYLEKRHEGMSTLNNVLCGQKSPNDKGTIGDALDARLTYKEGVDTMDLLEPS